MTLNGYFDNDIENVQFIPTSELEGVVGELGRASMVDRRRFVANIKNISRRASEKGGKSTAKYEFEKRLKNLPKNVIQDLLNGNLQIVDHTIYGSKLIGGKSQIDVFENADVSEVGLQNIDNRKLEKDRPFLLTGIAILSGVGTDATGNADVVGAVDFQTLPALIANGEMTLKDNKRTLLDKFSLRAFKGTDNDTGIVGYYKLDNPKWIEPQRPIDLQIELAADAVANTYVRVMLVGATVEAM